MTAHHGRFAWYELMTSDPEGARKFYGNVIGWGHQDAGMPGMDYELITVGDLPVGGMMTLPDKACEAGAKPVWIGYVAVDDVDKSAADFAANGGTVHRQPRDIPGVGRFAIVSDPHGATLALITEPDEATAARLHPMRRGFGSWHELLSPDWEAAFDFYSGRFGWKKDEAIPMGEMGTYQLYGLGDAAPECMALGGMMNRSEDYHGPAWTYYFCVDEISAATERVKASGGTVTMGPAEVPGGAWIINGIDPQGAAFALVAPPQ